MAARVLVIDILYFLRLGKKKVRELEYTRLENWKNRSSVVVLRLMGFTSGSGENSGLLWAIKSHNVYLLSQC